MDNNNQNILSTLLNAGSSQQTQQNTGNAIQTLLSLIQPNSNPQSANAALGLSTTNVLNNSANLMGNPNLAAGNYDATQNTGINQQQLAQALQNLTSMGGASNTSINTNKNSVPVVQDGQNNNQQQIPLSQQMVIDSAKKNYNKYLDAHAAQTSPQVLAGVIDKSGSQQTSQGQPSQQNPQMLQGQAQQSPNNNQPQGMTDAIQEQAKNIAMQKPGILGSFFKGMFEANQSAQLNVLKQAQEITQGGPPLSPSEKVQAIGNWNSALLQQHKDFQSDLSDQIKSNVDAQTAFIKNTPLPTKASDWPAYTQKLQEYSANTSNLTDRMIQGFNKYKNLQLTNPINGQRGNKNFGAGDTVMYNGKQRIIQSINEKTGKAILQ